MQKNLAEADAQPGAELTSVPARTADTWFTGGRLLLFLFFFLLAAYPGVMLGSHTFFHRDFGLYGYPVAHYFRECFWRGEVPLWNPLNDCGQPFAAQWGPTVFYPGALLYLLVPLRWSLGFFCLAHVLLAGGAMYALARRWTGNRFAATFAGVAFATNGLLMHSLMWPHYMATLAWMPLVVLWVQRASTEGGRAVVIAAFVGTMQMLSGGPELILFTWLFLAGWVLLVTRKQVVSLKPVLLRFSAVVGLVAGLAAIQLLPFLDLLAHSQRDTGYGTDTWAMPWWGPANFLLPLFHMTPSISGVFTQETQQFFSSYYTGIVTVALALWAMVRGQTMGTRWLGGLALIAAILAMGENGYVYAALKKVLPVLGFMRFPVKWLMLVVFILPLLAAFGLARWQREKNAESPHDTRWLIIVSGALVLTIIVLIGWARAFPVPREDPTITQANGWSRLAILAGATAGLLLWKRLRGVMARGCCAAGIVVLVGLDLLTHVPSQNPVVITQAFEKLPRPIPNAPQPGTSRAMIAREVRAFLDFAKSPDELTYYLNLRRSLFANCNLIEGVPKVDGFWPLELQPYSQVRNLLYKGTNALPAPLVDFLGVTHLSSRTFIGQWDERTTALPHVTGGQTPVFADESTTLAALASESFRPRDVVYLRPEDEKDVKVRSRAEVTVHSIRLSAHRWEFEVSASAPALVVIAQSFYHPWKAQVDGRTQQLLRANHAFQALEVPAGRHRVTLTYVDWMFRIGVTVSLATALLCGVLFWKRSVRTPHDRS